MFFFLNFIVALSEGPNKKKLAKSSANTLVLGQPAAQAQGGDRFGITNAAGAKEFPEFSSAQEFCPDHFIRVFDPRLGVKFLRLKDMDQFSRIAGDRINFPQARKYTALVISLLDQFPSGARERLFIFVQSTSRELQKISAEDRPVLVNKDDYIFGKKWYDDDGARMFDDIDIRVAAVGQFSFDNRETELFALEFHGRE